MFIINWSKIEKVFRLFFPEFSNKVTWAVIITGLGLTSSSIFQNILNEVLKKEFDFQILGAYDSLVGIVLIALGLTHNILLQREKTKIEVNGKFDSESEGKVLAREHDLKLFQKITDGFEEYFLTEYISSLNDDHSYSTSDKSRLRNFVYYSEETEYDFINADLNKKFTEFGQSLSTVMNWTATHFFHHPSHLVMENQRYCLYPELNPDRGGEEDTLGKYNEHAVEIINLTDDLFEKYKQFRTSVKYELYI
ncbi:conserved hypothetical protein [Psychromonas ingrahamii 37]|uniref:Uncharacterized protein n=1 Tax=Psychromonas ingrahamii (strain DSM 17664 / CCUG 51855 / 37) TaxID=357804 RepID=A1STK5_PSYIN|nr:hypothetical protein [Psychromonas ingrahamii]ABM02820.1 conserved hypothetical protein [Psychromonas ingrahamii 37]